MVLHSGTSNSENILGLRDPLACPRGFPYLLLKFKYLHVMQEHLLSTGDCVATPFPMTHGVDVIGEEVHLVDLLVHLSRQYEYFRQFVSGAFLISRDVLPEIILWFWQLRLLTAEECEAKDCERK